MHKNGCAHLGRFTGDWAECPSCNGKVSLKVYGCAVHGRATLWKRVAEADGCCRGCEQREEKSVRASDVKWACGLTTVPRRFEDGTLERTLRSLREAGFVKPRIFGDGFSAEQQMLLEGRTGCEVTAHRTPLAPWGNWLLGLTELIVREPLCHRYAMFQDDLLMARNAKEYLSHLPYEAKTYWNLFSFPDNEKVCKEQEGFHKAACCGKGAVALVFDRDTVVDLLGHSNTASRCLSVEGDRGKTNLDGGVYWTLVNYLHYREMVHWPCLTQHVGDLSTIVGRNGRLNCTPDQTYPHSMSFRGEAWDAMSLLEKRAAV